MGVDENGAGPPRTTAIEVHTRGCAHARWKPSRFVWFALGWAVGRRPVAGAAGPDRTNGCDLRRPGGDTAGQPSVRTASVRTASVDRIAEPCDAAPEPEEDVRDQRFPAPEHPRASGDRSAARDVGARRRPGCRGDRAPAPTGRVRRDPGLWH